MRRRDFLALSGSAALAAAPKAPNIVFILADDLGYGDVGCFGQSLIATPNMDALAAGGMRFTNAYAGAAVCAPSRCCLMTGKHTGHARIRDNKSARGERVSLAPDDVTVAEVLKKAGYRTGIIGKWGIGEAGTLGIPTAKGFDEWYGFLNQDHALDYYPNHLWKNQQEIFPGGNQGVRKKDYVQDLFTRRALEFITANRSNPFFLYLAYTIPHASSEIGRDTGDGYVVPSYGRYANRDWPQPEKGFAAMVEMLDRDVGRVMEQLKKLGLDSNTVVIFASDNGSANAGGHSYQFFSSSAGLRGKKGDLYEGGIRTPAIARWPGRVKAGAINQEPWAFWDFLPTAAELAGVPVPAGIDGISILPALLGNSQRPHEYLYWESHGKAFTQAARMQEWKAVRTAGRALELYNLQTDAAEAKDLAKERGETAARMEAIMKDARTESDDYPVAKPRA